MCDLNWVKYFKEYQKHISKVIFSKVSKAIKIKFLKYPGEIHCHRRY